MSKQRNIGLLGAISIGVGGMVGGGIFAILGEAVSLAHGATVIAFLLAGIVALFTSYSYAKLSVIYQSSGGTVTFIDRAFGKNLLSGSVNLMLWLCYLTTISLYAVAFASYGETFFTQNSSLLHHLLISFAIIFPAIINLLSASFVSKSEALIVAVKVLLLAVIIIFSIPYINVEHFSPSEYKSTSSIFVAGMIIFVAYEGFELIANASMEISQPEKNLPRAFYASVIFVILLYLAIAIVSVGTVPEAQLLIAKDYALAIAAKPALGEVGFTLVALAALLATFSAINATIFGNAKLSYILATQGELPKILTQSKRNIPYMGVIFTLALSLLLANSIDLSSIAIIGSAGFLLVFFIVNLSAYKLRKEIQANIYIVISATFLSFSSLVILLIHTYDSAPEAVCIFFAFIGVSFLFEMLYGRFVRGHFMRRNY